MIDHAARHLEVAGWFAVFLRSDFRFAGFDLKPESAHCLEQGVVQVRGEAGALAKGGLELDGGIVAGMDFPCELAGLAADLAFQLEVPNQGAAERNNSLRERSPERHRKDQRRFECAADSHAAEKDAAAKGDGRHKRGLLDRVMSVARIDLDGEPIAAEQGLGFCDARDRPAIDRVFNEPVKRVW